MCEVITQGAWQGLRLIAIPAQCPHLVTSKPSGVIAIAHTAAEWPSKEATRSPVTKFLRWQRNLALES